MLSINLAAAIIVTGIALWLIHGFFPRADRIRSILDWLVINAVSIWLLQAAGFWGLMKHSKFGQ